MSPWAAGIVGVVVGVVLGVGVLVVLALADNDTRTELRARRIARRDAAPTTPEAQP